MPKCDWYLLRINPEPWKVGPINYKKVGQDPSLKAFQEAVQEQIKAGQHRMIDGPIKLTFYFWHERVRYEGPNKEVVKNRVDVTNMQKATEDALQGVLFKNDRDVMEVHSYKMADKEGIEGTIILCVEEYEEKAPDIPQTILSMFDTQQDHINLDNSW